MPIPKNNNNIGIPAFPATLLAMMLIIRSMEDIKIIFSAVKIIISGLKQSYKKLEVEPIGKRSGAYSPFNLFLQALASMGNC